MSVFVDVCMRTSSGSVATDFDVVIRNSTYPDNSEHEEKKRKHVAELGERTWLVIAKKSQREVQYVKLCVRF